MSLSPGCVPRRRTVKCRRSMVCSSSSGTGSPVSSFLIGRGPEMKFGASMFFTDYSMAPAELAVALEQRGFDIVWAPEHSHIPPVRKTGFILGGELPKRYYDVMDPFVQFTAAAMASRTYSVRTGVCVVAQ